MNFPTDLFAGLRFAVVGLGKNGMPVARRLVAMGGTVIAWDDTAAARHISGSEWSLPHE